MASKSEVGHAKNVANLQVLIAFVNGYGASYNPSKTSLTLPELQNLYTQANASLNKVVNKNTDYYNAVNTRVEAFSNIRSLSTRLLNAIETTDASKEKIDDVKGYNRRMQGKRASKKIVPVEGVEPTSKNISSSQQSFVQLIQHFDGLISVLNSEPTYTPNETELQVVTLQTRLQGLQDANQEVATAYTAISNSRLDRNKILYNTNTGVVDIAYEVKKYVKSVFGATSPEFAQISSMKFTQ